MPEWGRGSTRASRALRTHVLTLWPNCYLHYNGCTGTSTEDDHRTPLSQGGTDHITNHAGACHNCHATKSAREAAQGRAAQRAGQRHRQERHPGLT